MRVGKQAGRGRKGPGGNVQRHVGVAVNSNEQNEGL